MTLNPGLIQKRCVEIEESLERLEEIKGTTKEEFLQKEK